MSVLAILAPFMMIGGGFGMGWGLHGMILTRRHIRDLGEIRTQLENLRRVV